MGVYTTANNPYYSKAFMLIADDDERDYGNTEKAMKKAEKWRGHGGCVISTRIAIFVGLRTASRDLKSLAEVYGKAHQSR